MSIIMLLALVVVLAVILAARRRGPRVTQITRTRRREKDSDDA